MTVIQYMRRGGSITYKLSVKTEHSQQAISRLISFGYQII